MKPKPIKRSEHIVSISREHHATLLFCWKLRQGVKLAIEKERIGQYVSWFWDTHLQPHFETEERLLFTETGFKKIKQALDEHQQILALCQELAQVTTNDFYDKVAQLADLVDRHTRYEERELFPWIEDNFDEERLVRIGATLAQEEHSAEENYEDEFWAKKK